VIAKGKQIKTLIKRMTAVKKALLVAEERGKGSLLKKDFKENKQESI
jgi:hypothetical protein